MFAANSVRSHHKTGALFLVGPHNGGRATAKATAGTDAWFERLTNEALSVGLQIRKSSLFRASEMDVKLWEPTLLQAKAGKEDERTVASVAKLCARLTEIMQVRPGRC